MTFRRDVLNYYQIKIGIIFLLVVSVAMTPIIELKYLLMYSFVSIIPLVMCVLGLSKLYKQYITINEIGISCHEQGKQLWAYEWDSIAELKRSRRYLLPSIEVITYDKDGKPELFAGIHKYFQLGKEAKEALRRYYKPVEQLRKV